jgi:hypothetical protein
MSEGEGSNEHEKRNGAPFVVRTRGGKGKE